MRPTIPLASWRIALDLGLTRSVQNQPGLPAVGCDCEWCAHWPQICHRVLPAPLQQQLGRLLVDAAHPAELYAYEEDAGGAYCRATYHIVGRLLSGPPAWRVDPKHGRMWNYDWSLFGDGTTLGLMVVPALQTGDARPRLEGAPASRLLQIDLRFRVPRALMPACSGGGSVTS